MCNLFRSKVLCPPTHSDIAYYDPSGKQHKWYTARGVGVEFKVGFQFPPALHAFHTRQPLVWPRRQLCSLRILSQHTLSHGRAGIIEGPPGKPGGECQKAWQDHATATTAAFLRVHLRLLNRAALLLGSGGGGGGGGGGSRRSISKFPSTERRDRQQLHVGKLFHDILQRPIVLHQQHRATLFTRECVFMW